MKFIKCFNLRSGLKETITEDAFVDWIRETLGKKTFSGTDNDLSKKTYETLKTLSLEDYREYITETWNISILKKDKPKTLKEFRTIISEYIKDKYKYANEYDKELLQAFCKDTIKFKISNTLPNSDIKLNTDMVYLYRINDIHYQALI